jgi:AraC family transcriptional regulator
MCAYAKRLIFRMASTTALLELLRAAEAAVDRDQRTARVCLERATALLRADQSGVDGMPPVSEGFCRGGMPRWQAKIVATYIDEHCGESISSADLIALTDLSSGHFFRTFKATFGAAPFAYIARRRIDRAQQLMLTTNEPLSQIALACGLCDQSHLTRLFRRIVGMSPRRWRREYGCRTRGLAKVSTSRRSEA